VVKLTNKPVLGKLTLEPYAQGETIMAENKRKVVCIEDEPEIIDLIRLILGRKGFELTGATGGLEGLQAIRQVKPDLVLLDLMMPDMDGWEVYQQMKADPELKSIPVIVVTAKAQSIDKILGLHIAKVDDYVTKPFGPQELLQSVERVLQAKEAA
jgi:two-component system response regulator VicR